MQERKILDETTLKEITAEGEIVEYCNYLPRSKSGIRSWEVKIKSNTGIRRVVVIRDSGISVDKYEVAVKPFKERVERNTEICRLYNEEHLSQVFLANLFNVTQPSISMIIKSARNAVKHKD